MFSPEVQEAAKAAIAIANMNPDVTRAQEIEAYFNRKVTEKWADGKFTPDDTRKMISMTQKVVADPKYLSLEQDELLSLKQCRKIESDLDIRYKNAPVIGRDEAHQRKERHENNFRFIQSRNEFVAIDQTDANVLSLAENNLQHARIKRQNFVFDNITNQMGLNRPQDGSVNMGTIRETRDRFVMVEAVNDSYHTIAQASLAQMTVESQAAAAVQKKPAITR